MCEINGCNNTNIMVEVIIDGDKVKVCSDCWNKVKGYYKDCKIKSNVGSVV